jgi:hypothetical protein
MGMMHILWLLMAMLIAFNLILNDAYALPQCHSGFFSTKVHRAGMVT